MNGDILLYESNGSIPDRLVVRATGGRYVHAAIVVTPEYCVEALSHGVTLDRIRPPATTLATGAKLDAVRLTYALNWVRRRVGSQYSGLDIVADGLKAVLPKTLSGVPFLVAPSQFDCSQLCCDFLTIAGYEWLPDEWYESSARVSPNDLARVLA